MTPHPDTLLSRFLPSEVADLAPWIAGNLDVLAPVLGLQSLTAVRPESPVGTFRLDLLADGTHPDGTRVPVAIEAQLGTADHDHLGKLVTYLSHQGRGIGVWVVDRATHPHLTAIDFLNRHTSDGLQWWLVTYVQADGLAPDPATVEAVPLAGPGIELPPRPVRPTPAGVVRSHPTRTEFLEDVLAATSEPSIELGWRNPRITNKGYAITWALPSNSRLRKTSVKLRCHGDHIAVHLLVQGYGSDNETIIEAARIRHAETLTEAFPATARLGWHEGQKSADSLRVTVPGVSWEGDAGAAPQIVLEILDGLLPVVTDPDVSGAA